MTPDKILKILRKLGLNKHSPVYILILIGVSFFYFFSYYKSINKSATSNISGNMSSEEGKVVKVVDGDTIDVESNGQKYTIRYIGIDTPETVKPNTPVQCFGTEASNKNKSLVSDKTVYLEKDVEDKDKYGRSLRYVYLKNEKGEKIMINKLLVEEGYASAATFPPNVKYQEVFRLAEKNARESSKGLWGSCPGKK